MWQGKYTRQLDAVTPKGGIVTYEVAGGSHMSSEVPGVPLDPLMAAAMVQLMGAGDAMPSIPGMPEGFLMNDFAWAPLVRGAYYNLQQWVRKGVVPPQAPGIRTRL